MAEKKISMNQQRAIHAIVAGKTRTEAAAAAGINDRTIYKWLEDPQFKAALRLAEKQAILDAQTALIGRIDENLQILDEIKRNPACSDNARIRAIQLQLETMMNWRDTLITDERIAAIEKRLEGLAR